MRLPRWNPEGFWRARRSYQRAIIQADRAGRDPLDLDELPPPTILVGRRRAKAMRRAGAKARQ